MEGPGPQTVDDHSPTRGQHPIARFLNVTIGRISGLLAFLGYQQARHLVRRVAGKLLCLLVSISLLAYLFHKVPLSQVFDVVTAARPAPLTAALLIALSSQLISAVRLKRLADAYGLDLSTFEVLQINFATRFYGLFLPAGNLSGNAIRFYKMSKPQKAYGGTAVSLFLDRMATTIALCVVGIAFWLLAIPAGPFPLLVLMFTALTVLLAVQAMLFIELPLPMLTGLRRRLGRRVPQIPRNRPSGGAPGPPLAARDVGACLWPFDPDAFDRHRRLQPRGGVVRPRHLVRDYRLDTFGRGADCDPPPQHRRLGRTRGHITGAADALRYCRGRCVGFFPVGVRRYNTDRGAAWRPVRSETLAALTGQGQMSALALSSIGYGDAAMNNPTDTRRSPRISCNLPMEYQIPGTHPRNGRITKLGTKGALLTTHETVPLGAELLLSFHLPLSKSQINTVGAVRWTSQGRARVEFIHLSLHQQVELWRYYTKESARKRQARS